MPSLHSYQRLLKLPFVPFSSFFFKTFISTPLNQPPPFIIQRIIALLQEYSKHPICVEAIHAHIIIHYLSANEDVARKLIKAYSDVGHLNDACKVFGQILDGNTLVWNAMIGGYLKNERYEKIVELYRKMRTNNGVEVDSCTCTFALKACTHLLDFESGMEIVRNARENGFEKDRFFGSSAISFLVKFGKVDEARDIFEELFHRGVVCWNSMIKGYVQMGSFDIAFEMFFQMQGCGIRPTPVTMAGLIQACIGIGSLRLGKCIHGCLNGFGMCCDILIGTSLIDMYGKMGDVESARQIFDRMTARNLISWNSMISGYVQNGLVFKEFDLFGVLVLSGGGFDSGTMASLLQGCTQLSSVDNGKVLHCCVLRRHLESNVIVSTTIVDLYAKSGAVKLARSVFSAMKEKNVISWTAMLMGLAQNGHAEEAFKIFCQMQEAGVDANAFTLVSLIHACAHVGSLKKGQSIHAYLIRHVFSLDEIVRTALIDMYSKCGKIESCKKVFENVSMSRDVVLWNSMITSYGMHGHGHLTVGIYSHMNEKGILPNQTSFVSLLSACSHSGLVDEGINLFHIMSRDHGIMPNEKHYACLVDLLGRAGRLEEAEALIEHMPFEPSSAVLEALLSGCKTHKNINIGIKNADRLLILDAMNPGIYVVLSNMYAEGRRWSEVDYVRGLMRKRGLRKTPGYSLTEVANVVHAFFAGDDSHPFREEIYKMLESIKMQIEASGYIPDTSCVLRDVDEQMKVKLLWGHSERLAIAFGLISTPSGSLIRITKNLRVCGDCHTVTEISRPENQGLSAVLNLLEELKKEIDSNSKGGPISFADLIQCAAQSALKRTFLASAIHKCGGNEEKGNLLYTTYGSNGQWGLFDRQFGRADSQEPDPEGRVPPWEKASAQEMKDKFSAVGLGPRQVDLINTLTKLSCLGQQINYEAYTYPVKKVDFGKLKL